jgi:hypothetical protein
VHQSAARFWDAPDLPRPPNKVAGRTPSRLITRTHVPRGRDTLQALRKIGQTLEAARSSSAFSSAPRSTTIVEIHIHVIMPIAPPNEP